MTGAVDQHDLRSVRVEVRCVSKEPVILATVDAEDRYTVSDDRLHVKRSHAISAEAPHPRRIEPMRLVQ